MSDSEQCSNRLEFDLNFTFGKQFMLIEANSDTSSVGPSNKDEGALIMQVVLKIYVYYNDKLCKSQRDMNHLISKYGRNLM